MNQFRPHRYADHLDSLNFGLLDIVKTSTPSAETKYKLKMNLMNHFSQPVIVKELDLQAVGSLNDGGVKQEAHELKCIPFHGEVPRWRMLLFRGKVAAVLFVLIVVPYLVVLWFVFASIFYIFYESEIFRRRNIDFQYKKNVNKVD